MVSTVAGSALALMEELGRFIGLRGTVEGRRVEWIDVLADGPSVVL
ncbi:MAG: hypothetical protein ACK4IT_10975 [Thioalkalivibrionaceae bacterium]